MFFFGFLFTFFLYEFYPKVLNHKMEISDDFIYGFTVSLGVFLFLPLVVFCIHYAFTGNLYFDLEFAPQLYIVDSFRGFTLDRIQYSYLVGILALVVYFEKKIIKNYKVILFLSTFALMLSMSRAVIVSLVVAILFYKLKKLVKIMKFLFLIGLFMILIFYFSPRMDIFSDGGGRIYLIIDSLKIIFSDINMFLFGYGSFYSVLEGNHQPHNNILQSLMNFGFIVTFLWLFLIFTYFKSLNRKAKAFFIYIFSFGFFYAGFSVLLFMPITIFGYVIIIFLNRRKLDESVVP